MIWRFRFPKARMRLRGKAHDREDSAPSPDEARRRAQQQFHAVGEVLKCRPLAEPSRHAGPAALQDMRHNRSQRRQIEFEFAVQAAVPQGVGPADDGPCVSVEGLFAGHEVWLRVLADAPDDEEPRMKFDATGRA